MNIVQLVNQFESADTKRGRLLAIKSKLLTKCRENAKR